MARKKTNHYEILGLASNTNASRAEIKQAYRKLVKSVHPDLSFHAKPDNQVVSETEQMMSINEAYETLMDSEKRAHYDSVVIRTKPYTGMHMPTSVLDSLDEEKARERYLRQVFHPLRRSIESILSKYKQRLSALSQDIYDEQLLEEFSQYVDDIEKTLLKASNEFTDNPPPLTLKPALQWMRHAIAQAADGLEELQYFCQNFDYDHLAMADNLFKIAREHSARALQVSKSI